MEYILIIAWVGLAAFFAIGSEATLFRKETVLGKEEMRVKPIAAIVMVLPLVWMVGQRSFWFADTASYYQGYLMFPTKWDLLVDYMQTYEKDLGFYWLSGLMRYVGMDARNYFLALACIQGICLFAVYRKYSGNFVLSFFLFVVSTDYISWMYNGIRQFTAVTIAFAATTLMLKKKYIPLLLVILLASTMHQSALLMIPFVIISWGKAWNKKTLLFMLGILLAVVFVDQFTNLLDDSLQDTQYKNVVSDMQEIHVEDDGTNPLRVLVYAVPTILAFFGRKKIQQTDDPVIHFCTNMSIISTGLYVVSMFTSGILLGRLPIYCSLYGYILLPWLVKHLFDAETSKLVNGAMIVFYLIFYYYQMHLTWGIM